MYNRCTVPVCTKRNSAVISLGLKLPLNKTHLNQRAWQENKILVQGYDYNKDAENNGTNTGAYRKELI